MAELPPVVEKVTKVTQAFMEAVYAVINEVKGKATEAFSKAETDKTLAEEALANLPIISVIKSGISPGDTNNSTAIQTLANTTSAAGGGILYFARGAANYYRMQEFEWPSNVWFMCQPGVSFKLPLTGRVSHTNIISTAGWEALSPVENIGCIGRLKLDISEGTSGETLVKAMLLHAVKGAHFDWIDVVPSTFAECGAICYQPNNAVAKGASENLVPTAVRVEMITCPGAPGGSGATQVSAGRDCSIGAVRGTGGISFRVETDAATVGVVDGFTVEETSNEKGLGSFSIVPHSQTIRNVKIGLARSVACAQACYFAPESVTLELGTITVDSIVHDGAGSAATALSGKTEGLYVTDGAFPFFTHVVNIGSLFVKNVTGSGARLFPQLNIGTCRLEKCEGMPLIEGGYTATLAGTSATIDDLKIVDGCGGTPEHLTAVLAQYLEVLKINRASFVDTRGGSSKMEYGVWAGKKSTIDLPSAYQSGLKVGLVRMAEEGYVKAARGEVILSGEQSGTVKVDLSTTRALRATAKGGATTIFELINANKANLQEFTGFIVQGTGGKAKVEFKLGATAAEFTGETTFSETAGALNIYDFYVTNAGAQLIGSKV